MFSRSDLNELVVIQAQPAISIYLPTQIAGREIRQGAIRLKNLLSSAAEGLAAARRKAEIDALLAPGEALVADHDFWRHQQQGLAVFLAPGFDRVQRLPIAVPERMVVSTGFYIKPLLPLLEDTGPFWLLTISARQARLYQGSRWTFAEVTGIDLPQGVGEIRGITQYEETHHAMPTGRRGTFAHSQSFGEAPEELRKNELIEFLRRVVAAFEPHLKANPAPVIVAAHPEIRGHFREIAGWKEIQLNGISENPDALKPDELRQRAFALAEQKLVETRSAALDRLNALLGTGKATINLNEIVHAARHARIERLFLSGEDQLWGRFDEAEDRVVIHDSAVEGDADLLNDAALMTLRQGGSVCIVEPRVLPNASPTAAILRY